MKKITIFLFIILPTLIFAQVGIGTNTPDASAKLDISATDKGFLPPRVALTGTTDVATILTPATGLMVYNTATAADVVPGYYYWDSAKWSKSSTSDLLSKTEGTNFTGSLIVGHQTTGTLATATNNTAVGIQALKALTAGKNNTAIGYQALALLTGSNNGVTPGGNTAVGALALPALNTNSTTGSDATYNTAIGFQSMQAATVANNNTAIGYNSLKSDLSGHQNTAIGVSALEKGTAGFNTAVGYRALLNTTGGTNNTAIGHQAGLINTTGTNNTFLGYLSTASSATLTNATALGNGATVTASNTIQLGNTSVIAVNTSGAITALQYKLSALNTAPATATDTGVTGEIRVTADSIYVCIATNTWVKAALATF